jgi:hypothetical protein
LCNRADDFGDFARTLLYSEVPHYFTWTPTKKWMRREQGTPIEACPGLFKSKTLRRVFTVNPRQTECFYLQLLLVNVTSPLSYKDICKVNGQKYPMYKSDLINTELNRELQYNIVEMAVMCDDIVFNIRNRTGNLNLQISVEIYNRTLIFIEDICLMMSNKILCQLGMTAPNRQMHDVFHQKLQYENYYDVNTLKESIEINLPLLNDEQKFVFDTLMKVINDGTGGIYFFEAPGGTGKTFFITLILATIRSKKLNCSCFIKHCSNFP